MPHQNDSGGALGEKDTQADLGRDAEAPPLGYLRCKHCGLEMTRKIIIRLRPDDERLECQWGPNKGKPHEWTDERESSRA